MIRLRDLMVLALGVIPGLAAADISIDNLRGEAYSDIGKLVHGYDGHSSQKIEGQYLNRLGVFITAQDTVLEKLRLTVGIGGIFWQPFPNYATTFWKTNVQFRSDISEASAEFRFTPSYALQGGYFPFKYGSSMDLGEYLMRSEAYPNRIATGSWSWVDSAYIRTLGVRLKADHFGGKFHHEVGVYWEYQNPPMFDVSPAYLFAWKPVNGVTVGGGVAMRRWFTNNIANSRNPTALSAAQYVTVDNYPEVQNRAMVHYTYDGGEDSVHAAWRPGANPDIATISGGKPNAQITRMDIIQAGAAPGPRTGIKKFLMNLKSCDEFEDPTSGQWNCNAYMDVDSHLATVDGNGVYTSRLDHKSGLLDSNFAAANVSMFKQLHRSSITAMGRIELDLGAMLDMQSVTGPMKLYGEAAVLGVQNQPVYYQKLSERIPIMLGAYLPTFGLLDLLAVETEYFPNPYLDSEELLDGGQKGNASVIGANIPVPDLLQGEYDRVNFVQPSNHGDDVKWAVHAVKTIVPGFKVKVQVANDHLRLNDYETLPSGTPQTLSLKQWYYMVHVQWGF
jgi:hypothetical protein